MITRDVLESIAESNAVVAAAIQDRNYRAIADELNRIEMIPNPVEQPNRPSIIPWSTFLEALSLTEKVAMYKDWGSLPDHIQQALNGNDRVTASALWDIIKDSVSAGTRANIIAALESSELDTSWPTLVPDPAGSLAQQNDLGAVTPEKVMLALR